MCNNCQIERLDSLDFYGYWSDNSSQTRGLHTPSNLNITEYKIYHVFNAQGTVEDLTMAIIRAALGSPIL
jgi:hypothetical protein